MLLHVRKARAGGCSLGYDWPHDGAIVQVQAEHAAELVRIPDGGFAIVEAPPEPEAEPEPTKVTEPAPEPANAVTEPAPEPAPAETPAKPAAKAAAKPAAKE